MKHYVYRITNIKLNKHYYGTRTSKKLPVEDIGYIYFSSSSDKNFILDQKENAQDYKYKVIKKYNTRKEAIKLEIKLHQKFDVGINESFYNRAKQSSKNFDTTGVSSPNKGNKMSKESIKKMLTTKNKTYLYNGILTTSAKQNALRASETMKKVQKNNKTIYQESAEKRMITEENLISFEGKMMTITEMKTLKTKRTLGAEGIKKRYESSRQSYIKNTKKYNIIKNNKIILENIIRKDIDKLSVTLRGSTSIKPLGSSRQSIKSLELNNKMFLLGLYCEEVKSDKYYEGDILKELKKLL